MLSFAEKPELVTSPMTLLSIDTEFGRYGYETTRSLASMMYTIAHHLHLNLLTMFIGYWVEDYRLELFPK